MKQHLSSGVIYTVVSVGQVDVVDLQRWSAQAGHRCGVTVQLLDGQTVIFRFSEVF